MIQIEFQDAPILEIVSKDSRKKILFCDTSHLCRRSFHTIVIPAECKHFCHRTRWAQAAFIDGNHFTLSDRAKS